MSILSPVLIILPLFCIVLKATSGNGDTETTTTTIETAERSPLSNLTVKREGKDLSLQSLQDEVDSWTKPPPLISLQSLIDNPQWIINKTNDHLVNEPIGLLDLFNECLEGWEAPRILQETFPYYEAGNDEESRPVWVAEAGKFNLRKIVEGGGTNLDQLDKYMRQAGYRIMKSVMAQLSQDIRNVEFRLILDFDGLNAGQLVHFPTLAYIFKYATLYRKLMTNHVGPSVIINANFPTETILNIWRPVWPAVLEKMDVYGTNKDKWLPRLRHHFPIEILPEWYGGTKQFVPLQVHG